MKNVVSRADENKVIDNKKNERVALETCSRREMFFMRWTMSSWSKHEVWDTRRNDDDMFGVNGVIMERIAICQVLKWVLFSLSESFGDVNDSSFLRLGLIAPMLEAELRFLNNDDEQWSKIALNVFLSFFLQSQRSGRRQKRWKISFDSSFTTL